LIEANALPLSQTANQNKKKKKKRAFSVFHFYDVIPAITATNDMKFILVDIFDRN